MPPGRPGDPNSDDDWFVTDWMDTTRAQEALHFQNHSWPELRAELSKKYRLLRYPGPLIARLVRVVMACRSPYRNAPGQYADPWGKYVPNWASRYGIGPKRFQRRRFHARPTAVARADQNRIW
jgi:hypothetical protein